MKTVTVIFLYLFIFTGVANAQAQSRGGVFAAAAVPGQAPVPPVVTPTTPQPQAPTAARPAGQAQPAQQQQEQLRIVADPATNSLIIYGTAQEFQNIKNILKDLDAVPRQVLLEVMIAEITLSDTQSLGVDYEVLARNPESIFGQKFGSASAIRTLGKLFPSIPTTAGTTSTFGGGVSGIFGGKDIKAFVNALQSDTHFRVLSTPSILATDNKPARIQVGTEEPIATGTISQAVGGIANSTSIQYRNTGRIVTIIPQVNAQGLVNLQILAEVSQKRDKNVQVGQDTFPAFDSRTAETTAVVQDGDTLVIGGIINDSKTQTKSGIPYLMDIPVIGRFFRTTTDTTDRTELIMMISPRVIRGRDEGRIVSEEFKNSLATIRNELERFARERAKLQPKPRPGDLPPMPDPNMLEEAPQPTPSNLAPGRGASLAPAAGSAPVGAMKEMIDSRNAAPLEGRADKRSGNFQVPNRNSDAVTPKPQGFALSLAPVRAETASTVVGNSRASQAPVKPNRLWAVQVAALAENKDAESLVGKLRKEGYQAYVVTSQVEEKIWHRVRVGQFTNQQEAQELKKLLAAIKDYRQAYVAAK